MWCLYQNQEKTRQTLPITVLLLLPAVFVRSWNAWSTTDSYGTWKEIKLSHQSGFRKGRSTTDQLVRLRVFCQRGFYSEAARYRYFLWSRKGLRYNMKVWHFKRVCGADCHFSLRLPLRQEVPSQSWRMLLQTLRTGNWRTSGKHLICYTILSEN